MTERPPHPLLRGRTTRTGPRLLQPLLSMVAIAGFFGPGASADELIGELPVVVKVLKTTDGRPFDYRIESRTREPGYDIYRLSYPSPVVTDVPQNNRVPAEYYVPRGLVRGAPKRPAVICMHILDGDFVIARMTCSKLAISGVPALMFKLPYYDERGLPAGVHALEASPELFTSAVAQAGHDVRRTIDLLASRPEVNPERIGIMGTSLGGIVAASAAGGDARLWRTMLVLAGGDLEQIIHHAHETRDLSRLIRSLPEKRQQEIHEMLEAVDPLTFAARLRDRARAGRVLMINATHDRTIPRAATEKLASALGVTDRVVWLEDLGHYSAMAEFPRLLDMAADFFSQDLPPGIKAGRPEDAGPAERKRPGAMETVSSLVRQAATIFGTEPEPNRCHMVDLELSATPKGEAAIGGRLKLVRGTGWRFRIECHVPTIGRAALGQGRFPWMLSNGGTLFKGKGVLAPANPLSAVDANHWVDLRMLAGTAAGVAIAPHALSPWVTITDDTTAGGPAAIGVVDKKVSQNRVRILFQDDHTTPREVTFAIDGTRGTITFHRWRANTLAHPAMFEPPEHEAEKEVERADLYRTFSAMFNFAMESIR